uniref:Uncharacterized protein n=1 Tax=Rhipicephalus zambeziensis TaxID=60191 RepID=A0A224YFX5_9ACAR
MSRGWHTVHMPLPKFLSAKGYRAQNDTRPHLPARPLLLIKDMPSPKQIFACATRLDNQDGYRSTVAKGFFYAKSGQATAQAHSVHITYIPQSWGQLPQCNRAQPSQGLNRPNSTIYQVA